MADYSEFPTTPTGWQERQAAEWETVTPLTTEDAAPPQRRVDLGALIPGMVFIVLAIVLMTGVDLPVGLLAGRRRRLGAAHRRRRRAAALRTPQGPPPAVTARHTLGAEARRARGATAPRAAVSLYSHSMVPGGLLVTSRTTRLTSGTSLVIRVEIRASTS